MNYRKNIAAIVAFLGGSYFFLRFVLPDQIILSNNEVLLDLQKYHSQISDGFILVGAMTIGLGLLSLLLNHGGKLLAKRQGWQNSLALLLGLFMMLFVSAKDWSIDYSISAQTQQVFHLKSFSDLILKDQQESTAGVLPLNERAILLASSMESLLSQQHQELARLGFSKIDGSKEALEYSEMQNAILASIVNLRSVCAGATADCKAVLLEVSQRFVEYANLYRVAAETIFKQSFTKQLYRVLFEGVFISLGSAIFSLLGFYIVTAAYRAFRVRNFESGLMMTAAVLVMLGQISIGLMLWSDLSEIRLWLLEVPNTAAFRAIELGASVAGLVLAFRMWLSIESDSFSGK